MAATGGVYLRYGSYSHAVGECSLSEHKEAVLSEERIPLYVRCRWDISGTLLRNTPAEIGTAIAAMKRAYASWGRDIGFYFAGGTATAHVVRNSSTMDGIRIVQEPQFPEGRGAEYSTFRNYTIGVEWEEEVNPKMGVLFSTQEIECRGNGGVDWEYVVPVEGAPESWPKTRRSVVSVMQSGTARGFGGFIPPAADPLWSSEPPLYGPGVSIRRRRLSGIEGFREVSWSYPFFFASLPAVKQP